MAEVSLVEPLPVAPKSLTLTVGPPEALAPFPESVMVAGELVALLATVTLPEALPVAVGAKVTLRVADWLGVKVVPALRPLALNAAPLVVTDEILTSEFPLFVTVAVSELLLLTLTLPKLRLVGLAPRSRVGAAPVPDSATASGELEAVLTREIEPVTEPAEVGAKTALKLML